MWCFSKLWIAVGNISAGFSCSDRSMDGLLGSPQTCPDRRWIYWYKHLSLCCMVHPYFGCCYDSSGFFSLISEVSISYSPHMYRYSKPWSLLHMSCFILEQMVTTLTSMFCFQSSADPLLAAEALISGIMISSSLRRIFRFIRRLYKYDFTILELNDYLPSSGIQDLLPFHPLRSSALICLIGVSKIWECGKCSVGFFIFIGRREGWGVVKCFLSFQ